VKRVSVVCVFLHRVDNVRIETTADKVHWELASAPRQSPIPTSIEVLYHDDAVVVVDKPLSPSGPCGAASLTCIFSAISRSKTPCWTSLEENRGITPGFGGFLV
jgi:hypothetical protein